ncbi:MAG TPA: hypothetical protein PKM25_12040, partial [Candidatus Ozemobacteraceae bacterium]|nr:hypothetical protein [Candidatus Ozemobacteraceae bacterium]
MGVISLGALLFAFGCGYNAGEDAPGRSLLVLNGSVSGRVLDNGLLSSSRLAAAVTSGQPLGGAAVWVEELPDRKAVTGSDGSFVIGNIPLGSGYHLIVRHEDSLRGLFRYRSEAVTVTAQQDERQVDLGIQKADRAVTVVVCDSAGNVLQNGSVTFWGETRTAGPQGRIAVQMPDNTALDIIVAAPGKDSVIIPVLFEANAQGEVGIGLQNAGTGNSPPLVRLNSGSIPVVARKSELVLTVTASDADGDVLTYDWTGSPGIFAASGTSQVTARWQAPDFDTTASVAVTVSDGRGGRASAVLGITVGAGGFNQPPTASILASTTRLDEATALRLYAQVSDPDGDSVGCLWQADRGSLDSTTGTSTVWISPLTPGLATIWLTAGDSRGAFVTTTLLINVLAPNVLPTLAISATGSSVLPNVAMRLTAQTSDADGDQISCSWAATGGTLSTTDGSSVAWQAPAAVGLATVTCLADDGRGG